jgi:ribosomal-protein-alanine N-acetyltransferase
VILPVDPLIAGQLTMRPWRAGDAALLARAWADPEIARWTAVPDDISVTAAARWIGGSERRRETAVAFDRVIESNGSVAGEIGLAPIDWDRGAAQVGYWILPECRGQGLAASALRAITGWVQAELPLKMLVARCDPANGASIAVASAAGYTLERADPEGFDLYVYRA